MNSNDPRDPKYVRCPKAEHYSDKADSVSPFHGSILTIFDLFPALWRSIRFAPFVFVDIMALFKIFHLDKNAVSPTVIVICGILLCLLAGRDFKRYIYSYYYQKSRQAREQAWHADHPDINYYEALWEIDELPKRKEFNKELHGKDDISFSKRSIEEARSRYLSLNTRPPLSHGLKMSRPIFMLLVVNLAFISIPVLLFLP